MAADDHEPRVIPLFLVIAGDDQEFAPFEGIKGMLEGLDQLNLLRVVDAVQTYFEMTVAGGLQIDLTPVEGNPLGNLGIEPHLRGPCLL